MFLDQGAPGFFAEWDTLADDTVAALRIQADRSPLDRNLSDLIGELATRSDEFRTRWARPDVRLHRVTQTVLPVAPYRPCAAAGGRGSALTMVHQIDLICVLHVADT